MEGRDFYFRYNAGPIQHTRVWDAKRFFDAQVDAGLRSDVPYVVTVSSKEEYDAQRKEKKHG